MYARAHTHARARTYAEARSTHAPHLHAQQPRDKHEQQDQAKQVDAGAECVTQDDEDLVQAIPVARQPEEAQQTDGGEAAIEARLLGAGLQLHHHLRKAGQGDEEVEPGRVRSTA